MENRGPRPEAGSSAEASDKAADRVRRLVPAAGYQLSEPEPVPQA